MTRNTIITLLASISVSSSVPAEEAGTVQFEKDVLPVLEMKCMTCHREAYKDSKGRTKKPKGDLRMDHPEELLKGGESGDAVVPKKPEDSLMLKRVSLPEDDDDFMPPKGDPMTEAEVAMLKKWIAEGASFGNWKGTKFTPEGDKIDEGGADAGKAEAPAAEEKK